MYRCGYVVLMESGGIPVGDEIAARDHDLRRTAIYRLAAQLGGAGYVLALDPDDPELEVSHGGQTVTVNCRRRASDGGRLWYFIPPSEPLAEVDLIHDAVVAVKGRMHGAT